MKCRLCFDNLNDDFISIYEENEEAAEADIAKIITKYFNIVLSVEEKMCTTCWLQLHDFHQFWLRIEQRQETLKWKHFSANAAASVEFKSEAVLLEEAKPNKISFCAKDPFNDDKDKALCEPQIQIHIELEASPSADQEFAAASEATGSITSTGSSEEDGESENDSFLPKRNRLLWKIKEKSTQGDSEKQQIAATGTSDNASTLSGQKNVSVRLKLDAFLAEKACQLKCSICSADQFSSFNALLIHFRMEHNKPGYMLCCNRRFPKRSLYADHLKWHDNPEIFKCFKCNKHLSGQKSLKHHMTFMHPPQGEEFFQCEFCPRKFSKQYILTNHIKSNCEGSTNNKKVCGLCSMSFRLRVELKDHLKQVHSHELGQMCDICGKNLKTKSTLLAHIQAVHHVGEQLPEVQCSVCSKWFRNEHSLESHMYKHRDEASGRQYVCNICGAVKATRQTLHSHKKYHHSGKVHECTMCDKTFKRELNLREHVATHTGEALYHCEFCKQTFKSHRNKYAHLKKAHPAEFARKSKERLSLAKRAQPDTDTTQVF